MLFYLHYIIFLKELMKYYHPLLNHFLKPFNITAYKAVMDAFF